MGHKQNKIADIHNIDVYIFRLEYIYLVRTRRERKKKTIPSGTNNEGISTSNG